MTLGLVAFVAGAGIGLPHAVKSGVTPTTFAGLCALVSGVCLLAWSARRMVAPMRGWRRRAAFVAYAVLVALVAWTFVPAVMATNVPSIPLGARTPADVGLAYVDVDLMTEDGVRLAAWYVPSTNGAAVVIRHGAGSTRADVLDHAAVLAGGGYGTLLVDARGHGGSGGRAMDFGWNGDADTAAAVDYLATSPDVDPTRIAVVGLSMGGEEAIGALAADDRIRALVAEGATGRTGADNSWLSEEFGLQGWFQEQLDVARYALVDALTTAPRPRSLASSAAAARPRPVLLITAGDVADEGHAARHIQSASPTTVQMWNVPGVGHTDGLAADRTAWQDHVLTFLDDHVTATGPP
jgi:pimeloyl-ACP methyl ester carboxylesterase